MLVGLYEAPDKPSNAMNFIREYFQKGSPDDDAKT